jgi:hypothetical protein
MTPLDHAVATAILGVDTLWGGDVSSASGTGRFIADSWFSDEPLPEAYTHPAAARVREAGGIGERLGPEQLDAYLGAVDIPGAVRTVKEGGERLSSTREGRWRGRYLVGLAACLEVIWELALERAGRGGPVPYARCVEVMTGAGPEPSRPEEKRRLLAELLAAAGHPSSSPVELLAAVDAWRRERLVPAKSIAALSTAFIAELDALSARNLVPFLPAALREVPRANVRFLPIENAWFSGSMNYLGRSRRADGAPEYEATYELNASLSMSVPEFAQLVSHEVVPGHVTTFAWLQDLYVRGLVGFEATVLTMNSRSATLFEGIANNALLMAYGVTDPALVPDRDLVIGLLLAHLQDDAKNQSSYLTWQEGRAKEDVEGVLRRDYLVSEERADKLSGAWGRHPLNGRMYLPAYRFGTETVARLRSAHPPEKLLPALYGARGLVDVVTLQEMLAES